MVDFTQKIKIKNYFFNDKLYWQIQISEYLFRLSFDLSIPILEHSKEKMYLPSQLIGKFLKNNGFDGLIYNSSMSNGRNIALFDISSAIPSDINYYRIKDINISTENIDDYVPTYDRGNYEDFY